jgi:hypothetical protein
MTLIFLSISHSVSLLIGSINGISPLLFNAGLVSHYRRYLNPVDPRMLVTNGSTAEHHKVPYKGEFVIFIRSTY